MVLGACAWGDDLEGEDRQGGGATVDDRTATAFTHPIPGLDDLQAEMHLLGRGPFAFKWMPPQLGPLFNHDSCVACHGGNGRGRSQIAHDVFGSQALVRASLLDGEPEVPGGAVPLPGLGTQLQDHAVVGAPEVFVTLEWIEQPAAYANGDPISLRYPRITIRRPNGDPMPPDARYSYRQAPGLAGVGLLDAVSDETLRALADPDDADGDGISGRVNLAWDARSASTVPARFGHKASVPALAEQVAAAFANDMGLTNRIFPEPDGTTDVSSLQLDQVAFHVATLAVPAAASRSAAALRGRVLFDDFACSKCHLPTLVTGPSDIPQLAHQTIHPYTDLLLHDVGDLLTDARTDFLAEGVEWRTPPLWGLGLVQVVDPEATFLHDGRARTVAEAIFWHGGEAEAAREAFRTASRRDRDALLAFLATL
ncbi:MAG: thiol oxidoreductase [Deltaproteobacteria bacterium]|nr:thiol oxidoreductase [Deltaproteobacteria bacterium]